MNNYTENNQQLESVEDNEIEEVLDKVEKLPEEKRRVVYQKLEIFQGDLPHPNILKGYSELYPDAAKRIIENGIAETEHRRAMEKKYLYSQTSDRRLGQILGFIIAVLIITGGIYLIMNGHVVTGSAMTGLSAIGIIGLFTGSNIDTKNEKKEEESNSE